MSNEEFLDRFNVLYDNVSSKQAPGLDEYEISVLATKAQDEILKGYFSERTNKLIEGYDDSERRQIDFSSLNKHHTYNTFGKSSLLEEGYSVKLEEDILVIINETIKVSRNSKDKTLIVVPLTKDEYTRLSAKPFFRPLKNQAWRMLDGNDGVSSELLLGIGDIPKSYIMRYLRVPYPIILGEGITLNGKSTPYLNGTSISDIPEVLHEDVLQRTVENAKAIWEGANSQIAMGNQSVTNLGMVK